jgi:two-component system osmolarity sensor histidine kinase EnvZ
MPIFRLQSYFWKILFTIGVVSIGFLFIVLSTIAYYMVIPLGQRATDDLASIIFHAAETWERLPPDQTDAFARQMQQKHNLVVTTDTPPLAKSGSLLPYLFLLEASLEKQLGHQVDLKTSTDESGEQWFWADIPQSRETLRFGFPRSRIGVKPSIAFFVLLITGFYLTFITATLLTRRLTTTIERLYQAAQLIGKGQFPDPVPEEGPEELVVLAREFNRMNTQVKELLANRTTLLAGISHDLRTPLTQIQLALAMLPNEGGNPKLMKGIHRDLESVNHLISQALQVNLELGEQETVPTDITEILEHAIATVPDGVTIIKEFETESCKLMLNQLAFQRIISNLLENAVRYGEGKPITIAFTRNEHRLRVDISDQGPGIPEDQREAVFQPFFRLEKSRSSKTGGSGLGLAIVRQLASSNGWKVTLSGGPRDRGTRASLEIPLDKTSTS